MPSRAFVGEVDEVSVWSDELTAALITQYMTGGVPSNATNLVGLWTFDQCASTTSSVPNRKQGATAATALSINGSATYQSNALDGGTLFC